MAQVKTGLEALRDGGGRLLRGRRVGLLCHQASVTGALDHAVDVISSLGRVRLVRLFAPEHGLWGAAQDQVPIKEARDPHTGLPVVSLYGKRRTPAPEDLADIDILLCDLQDAGSRYYTFIWTMALAMKACAGRGTKLVVLDRPNPLGGTLIEGNVLDPRFSSFVGLYPVPVRHGMTIGELAGFFNAEFEIGCDLEVIRMRGWRRAMRWEETGLPWVAPSPNMPAPDTARVYPGSCLIEGTNLSEGRGTTRPFEWIGAPFIAPHRWARALGGLRLPGVSFRPCFFRPAFHKWKERDCGGVQLHVTDPYHFKPYLTGIGLISTARQLYPDDFAWRKPPYEFERKRLPIDLLCGTDTIIKKIERGLSLRRIEAGWQRDLAAFARDRQRYLLYR